MRLSGWFTCQLLLLLPVMGLVLAEPCTNGTTSKSDVEQDPTGDLDDDYSVPSPTSLPHQASNLSQVDVAPTYVEMEDFRLNVESKLDVEILLQNLKEAEHGKVFRVRWVGTVAIEETFRLSKGVTLHVVGSSPRESEVNARGNRQHFVLKGGSSLHLANITLAGGSGKGYIIPKAGGSIYLTEGSWLTATDCIFFNNSGASGGAVYAVGSKVTFAGQTNFTSNSANQFLGGGKGGAVGGRPKLAGAIDIQQLLQGGAKKLTHGISAIQDSGVLGFLGIEGSSVGATAGSTMFGELGNVVNGVMRSIYSDKESMLLLKDDVSFRGNSASSEGGELSC